MHINLIIQNLFSDHFQYLNYFSVVLLFYVTAAALAAVVACCFLSSTKKTKVFDGNTKVQRPETAKYNVFAFFSLSISITCPSNISISSCFFLAQDCFQHSSLLVHVSSLIFSILKKKNNVNHVAVSHECFSTISLVLFAWYRSYEVWWFCIAHTNAVSCPKNKSERLLFSLKITIVKCLV